MGEHRRCVVTRPSLYCGISIHSGWQLAWPNPALIASKSTEYRACYVFDTMMSGRSCEGQPPRRSRPSTALLALEC